MRLGKVGKVKCTLRVLEIRELQWDSSSCICALEMDVGLVISSRSGCHLKAVLDLTSGPAAVLQPAASSQTPCLYLMHAPHVGLSQLHKYLAQASRQSRLWSSVDF